MGAPETTQTLWVTAHHGRNDTQQTEQPYRSMRERASSAIPLLLAHPGVKGPNDAQERHRSGGYHILACVLVLVTQATTTGSCVASAPLEMVKHGTRGENEHKPPKDSVERHTKHVKAHIGRLPRAPWCTRRMRSGTQCLGRAQVQSAPPATEDARIV